MKLAEQAVVLVAKMIREGRAGAKPFGIPLEVWQREIERRRATVNDELEQKSHNQGKEE